MKPNGGPAFPIAFTDVEPVDQSAEAYDKLQGMSLRDWFAGMALQGLLAANAKMHEEVTDKNVDAIIAREAYASADAMLAVR